jgi:hypothetical protein
MTNQSLLERAANALKRAMEEPNNGRRSLLMEEALRLHKLAIEEAEITPPVEPNAPDD